MTALLIQSTSKSIMDHSNIFGYDLDTLSGLLPEPPSQPPPDTQGPPILSHNEVSQFNSHIEALTSPYTHTPNWKDGPKAGLQNGLGNQDLFLPEYHGVLNGDHLHLSGNPPQGTIAPQQLFHNDMHLASNHSYMPLSDSTYFASAQDGLLQVSMNRQRTYLGETTPHQTGMDPVSRLAKSPNGPLSPEMTDFTTPSTFSYLSGLSAQPNLVQQSSAVPPPIQARMRYGSDPSYTSNHFAPQEKLVPPTERTFAYYGLEPEASVANTRRNSPVPEAGGGTGMSPKAQRKQQPSIDASIPAEIPPTAAKVTSAKKLKLVDDLQPAASRHRVEAEEPAPKAPPVASSAKSQRSKPMTGSGKRGRKKGSPRANLTKDQRMANHRTSEQNRRNRTKKAKNRLWVLIPALKQRKKWAEKNQLDEASKQIKNVKAGNEALREQLRQLQRS